jgi:lipopolysaccharide/colanic/teichoic acid biosynthesis glycosyltransferase
VHRIVVSVEERPDAAYELIRASKQLGVRVSFVPGAFGVLVSSVEVDELTGMVLLGLRPFGLPRSSTLLKRTFDFAGAAAGLVAAAPLLAVAAIAIKLGSRGPVLFRQTRIGRGGERFEIFKLRTMVDGADARKASLADRNEADGLFKIADDPRITRVGRLLRRTSLDELPQLLNVLRGEMSLVGPRPLVADEDAQITGFDRRRLTLTPGMTGPWQIAGSARIPLSEMIKIDYRYVAAWSLWADIKILLRTVVYAVQARGQ